MTAYRPGLDGTGRYAVIGCKLKQNASEGCNSCASLAGLVLSFTACFILLVIAPLIVLRCRGPSGVRECAAVGHRHGLRCSLVSVKLMVSGTAAARRRRPRRRHLTVAVVTAAVARRPDDVQTSAYSVPTSSSSVSAFHSYPLFTRICFTDVFFCFFLFFSVRHKNTRQPFSGTAERIFMKLLPNDSGENVVSNVVPILVYFLFIIIIIIIIIMGFFLFTNHPGVLKNATVSSMFMFMFIFYFDYVL